MHQAEAFFQRARIDATAAQATMLAKGKANMSSSSSKKPSDETKINRRAVLQTLAMGLGAVGLGRAVFACDDSSAPPPSRSTVGTGTPPTDGDEYVPGTSTPQNAGDEIPKVPNQSWEARVKQLESEQARLFRPEVFTMASPGIMAGKERSHVPGASVVDENGMKRVVAIVQHVMGANKLDAGPAVDAGYDAAADAAKDAAKDAAGDAEGGLADAEAGAPDAEAGAPKDGGQEGGATDAGALPIHYITTIYLRAVVNGVDTVVGLYEFQSTDPAPPSVKFTLPVGVDTVVPFEWCTLHGLWQGDPLKVV